MSQGQHNCGCQRSRFIADLLRKHSGHRCVLCLKECHPEPHWRIALDDEDPVRCSVRRLPLCQTHADMWGEQGMLSEMTTLSNQRRALVLNYRRVQLDDGRFIFVPPSTGVPGTTSPAGVSSVPTQPTSGLPPQLSQFRSGRVFVDRRRTSILASADAVQQELERIKNAPAPAPASGAGRGQVRKRKRNPLGLPATQTEAYDSTSMRYLGSAETYEGGGGMED